MATSYYPAENYGSGSFTAKLLSGQENSGQIVLPYKVTLDAAVTSAAGVMAKLRAAGFTMPGSAWPASDDWVVAKIAPKHVTTEDQKFWLFDVTLEPNPLHCPDEVQVQASHYTETVFKDEKTFQVFQNKAGVPFEKGFDEQKGRARIEITRNLSSRSAPKPEDFAKLLFHKNYGDIRFMWKGEWYSYGAETMYCVDVRAPFYEEPAPYYRVTSAFELDPKKWIRHPLNAGYETRESDGKLHPAKSTGTGVVHGRMILLDIEGKALKKDYPPIFLDCDTIPQADFIRHHLIPGT